MSHGPSDGKDAARYIADLRVTIVVLASLVFTLATAKMLDRIRRGRSARDKCDVNGCDEPAKAKRTLKPLYPIRNDSEIGDLCGTHVIWAERRNRVMHDVIREMNNARERALREHEDSDRLIHPDYSLVRGPSDVDKSNEGWPNGQESVLDQ